MSKVQAATLIVLSLSAAFTIWQLGFYHGMRVRETQAVQQGYGEFHYGQFRWRRQ